MPADLTLSSALDMRAAGPLLQDIRGLRGADAALDASGVERLGAQCLQVLMAAQAAWAADGRDFQITSPSTAFKDAWALMGAAPLAPVEPSETVQ